MGAFIFFSLIIAVFLAILPAQIAQRKGKEFIVWYIYGFLFWIVAVFHAISLPEPTQPIVNYKKYKIVNNDERIRKMADLNSPVEILKYEILIEGDNASLLNLEFDNLDKKHIIALKLEVKGYDSFDEIINIEGSETFEVVLQDLNGAPKSIFKNNNPILLQNNKIRKLEILIKQIRFKNGENLNINKHIIVEPTLIPIIGEGELEAIREIIPSAKYMPKQEVGYWSCTCGRVNHNNSDTCNKCHSAKEKVFFNITYDNLKLILKNKRLELEKKALENEKELQQKIQIIKKMAMRAVKIGTILLVIIIISTFTIIQIRTYSDYKTAINLSNDGKYDEAISIMKSLGNYKNSEGMKKQFKYDKALHLIENKNYGEAVFVLEELGDYSDAPNLLLQYRYDPHVHAKR